MQKVQWYVDGNLSERQFDRQMRMVIEGAVNEYHKNVEKRKGQKMEVVYEVIVVTPELEIIRELVIATSKENAKFDVLRRMLPPDQKPDDIDVFVGEVGTLKKREE
jgi:hypothetical protein